MKAYYLNSLEVNDNNSENDVMRLVDCIDVRVDIGVADGIMFIMRVNIYVGVSLGLILRLILDN